MNSAFKGFVNNRVVNRYVLGNKPKKPLNPEDISKLRAINATRERLENSNWLTRFKYAGWIMNARQEVYPGRLEEEEKRASNAYSKHIQEKEENEKMKKVQNEQAEKRKRKENQIMQRIKQMTNAVNHVKSKLSTVKKKK